MKVYRLEGSDGRGPYVNACPDVYDILRENCWTEQAHPGVYYDVPEFTQRHYCAFVSKQQLREWFGHVVSTLILHGYSIVEYEVDISYVAFGSKQVGFVKSEATSRRVLCKGKGVK